MPPKKTIYQFKITLSYIQPPIWRRIQVPSTYTFWDLHVAIQNSMGWEDFHRHEFMVETKTGETLLFGIPLQEEEVRPVNYKPVAACWEHKISEYKKILTPYFLYGYNFRSKWQHKIEIEKIIPALPKVSYPRCLSGKGHCPLEDSGGVARYMEILKTLNNPDHEDYESTKRWVDDENYGSFNPDEFNPKDVVFEDPKECLEEKLSEDFTEMDYI